MYMKNQSNILIDILQKLHNFIREKKPNINPLVRFNNNTIKSIYFYMMDNYIFEIFYYDHIYYVNGIVIVTIVPAAAPASSLLST